MVSAAIIEEANVLLELIRLVVPSLVRKRLLRAAANNVRFPSFLSASFPVRTFDSGCAAVLAQDDEVVRVNTDLVVLNVTVLDKEGGMFRV